MSQLLEMQTLVKTLESENRYLREQLALLKKALFGPRSEKIQSDHPQLPFLGMEEVHEPEEVVVADDEGARPKRERRKTPHGRKPLPAHLPRERVEHHPPKEDCTCKCGDAMKPCGEDITEELEYIPASFRVKEHARIRYACRRCQEKPVQLAALPRPIEKGRPGPGLIAHVLTSKYADHIPLNRQSQIMAREGVDIARSTLCDWVADGYDRLGPLLRGLKHSILQSRVVGNDDTKIIMQLNHRGGGRKTCYLWSSTGDRKEVYFDFTTGRGREGPTKFFGNYQGTIVVDGYGGYNELFSKKGVREAGCWAHARRYFVDAMRSDPDKGSWVVSEISELYGIEKKIRELRAEEKVAIREKESKPILAGLFEKLEAWKIDALPKSAWGKAVNYALNRKEALLVFARDGEVPIDNNATERTIRNIAVGRKNWLFTGSVEGGKRAAGIYSLIGTCKLQGIDPWEYLRDVLERAPHLNDEELAKLIPRLWKEERKAGCD
ncbi:MAG: IS66 family transposase [bacterium]|jgi:transposase|nr:IS66 family transposase [bacterium]